MNPQLGQELIPENEDQLIQILIKKSMEDLDEKGRPMLRQQHPKSHGLVKGEFLVEPNLPEFLKIGVFQQEKFDILIRFSNSNSKRINGHLQPDTVGDGRGMAIKLLNVGDNQNTEQDFIAINHPVMFIKDVKGYLDLGVVKKAIAEGKIILQPNKPPQIPDELQETFQSIAYAFEILNQIQAKVITCPLDVICWSTTPYKLGDQAIKFQFVPQQTQTFKPETAENLDNYLREEMKKYLEHHDAYFDFKVQLQTNPETMPIEDPTIEWPVSESPFIKVATIKIPQQIFDTEDIKKQDERLSFSPWHCLPEHQPLGGVNRARNKVYSQLSQKRMMT